MPGETINIMEMAEMVSTQIFSRFGWKLTGPCNENFQCLKPERHKKTRSPTHPVDAVFEYDDPYTNERNYILSDFKSYASGSIVATNVRSAIINLSKAVDCANISPEWQDKYVNRELNWTVHGMLFIYNHDGNFDKYFDRFLIGIKSTALHLPKRSKIFILEPNRISYLLNILNDIDGARGRGDLPFDNKIEFWYPDLINRRPASTLANMARIELLMGPWQILPYEKISDDTFEKGLYIYYSGSGNSPKEFEFLMDFAFKNQLVQQNYKLFIRAPNAAPLARQHFEVAKDNYFNNFYSIPELRDRLDQFSFHPIDIVTTQFRPEEIGMGGRNG